ncbi:putative fimbrial protein StaF [Citrobacter koseri]|uniref:Putative fimbrial protein StaF n=1 Tax=Citrobacter koseri TaxID=545 RepID=A0A447URM7_CITKO|nr:putative fimbrial protein StaF [Citrobacter koseri]
MRQTLFFMRFTFALLVGLAGLWPVVSQADDSGMDVNFKAKILANTCQVSLENGGNVELPTVTRSWFYNTDNSDRLRPETDAGVQRLPFRLSTATCRQQEAKEASSFIFDLNRNSV